MLTKTKGKFTPRLTKTKALRLLGRPDLPPEPGDGLAVDGARRRRQSGGKYLPMFSIYEKIR
jgi:hypothetical protein